MKSLNALLLNSTAVSGMLLSSLLMAAPAHAAADSDQDATASSAAPGNDGASAIIVTGSRITRPNTTAAAPVQSVTSESIREQAAVNIEDVLNRIPQIAPDSQQNYQDSDGRQRIKLRNLGFERTLVLVDGKRLGTQNGEDADMIPTALIKRVDVLTGGASAVYGSDAVAGVVNFIMDDDFEGIELNSNYNFYAHDNRPGIVSQTASGYGFGQPAQGFAADGGRTDISLTAGKKLLDGRLHVSAYVDYRHADLVPYSAREISGCQLNQSTIDGPLSCQTSTYTPYGYVSPQSGANAGNSYVNNPDGTRTFVPYSNAVAANPYDGYSLQRRDNRWNAGGFASFEISDAATLYANAMWFADKSVNVFPPRVISYTAYGDTPYQVSCNNPYLSPSQAQTLCGSDAGTSTAVPVELRYRLANAPGWEDRYYNTGLRVSTGLRGHFADVWTYDIGGVYARNQQEYRWSLPDFNRVNNALNVVNNNGTISCANDVANGCVPFDPFSANSATNTAALWNYLLEGTYGTQTTVNTLYQGLATVQGDLGKYGIKSPWAEQGVALAISAEYREDKLASYADAIWREQNGGSDSNLSQNVKEAMVEVQAPIAEHRPFADLLQLNGAYRLSKYSSNPTVFSTWKAEAIWSPIPDITLRGSINRAQRAPTVVEAYQGANVSYGRITTAYNDICAPTVTYTTNPQNGQQVPVYGAPVASAAACKATGLADNLYGSPTLLCPTDVGCTYRSGGFTVDPETAYTKTFGVILKPRFLPGLTVSVDRFLIDLNQSIGYNDYSYFSNGCAQTGSAFFCDMFVRNADGTLYSNPDTNPSTGFIRQGTTNYYKSKAHGWDIQGQYAVTLGSVGRLDFDFAGTLTTYAGGQDSPILDTYNCAGGYYGGPCGQLIPHWVHTLRTTFTTRDGQASVSLNWRHLSSLTNVSNSGDPALGWTAAGEQSTFYRIPSYDYLDLAVTFKVSQRFTMRLAANNLLDKDPPVLPNSYNYGLSRANTLTARYDPLGRQIAVGATVKF